MRKILLFTLVMFSLFVRGQGTITFISTNSEDNALDFVTSITDNAAAQIKYCNDISNYVITFKESTTLTDAEKFGFSRRSSANAASPSSAGRRESALAFFSLRRSE